MNNGGAALRHKRGWKRARVARYWRCCWRRYRPVSVWCCEPVR